VNGELCINGGACSFSSSFSGRSNTVTVLGPTVTSSPSQTNLSLSMLLHGIGNGGDNANPVSKGTFSPLRPSRNVSIEFYNSTETLVTTKLGTVNFTATSGDFKGTINLGTMPTGAYTMKIKTDQYLKKTVPGIYTMAAGTLVIPAFSLITGDTNNDNQLNVLDYNLIIDCFSDLFPAKNCDAQKKLMTDITDDGFVKDEDYNLFLRELLNRQGE
jgi:hypothetical protein